MKLTRRMLVGLAILAATAGTLATLAGAADATGVGTLVLRGGIKASIKLNPTNCAVGPGSSFIVNSVRGGGWDSLDVSASDPTPGHRGTAEVDLTGTGFATAPYAVDDWVWTAKKTGHLSKPLNIAANGKSGTIDVVLPVADTFQGPKAKAVRITVTWKAGTCKG